MKSVECYNVKDDKWNYIAAMKEGRRECSMCASANNIYIIGGIRYVATIYSHRIEIVDISKKCISRSIEINNELFSGICTKVGIPLNIDEIMIFGDSLLVKEPNENGFSGYKISLTDANMQFIEDSEVYSAFTAYNYVELVGKEYLIIPDFLESLSDGANGSLLHVNANTKKVSRINVTC